MSQPTIDVATFDALKETTGGEFVVELVETFLAEAPPMLAELRATLASGHADAFRRAAHSLKSNSSTFGALALAAMARELELGGQAPVLAANARPLDELEQEYARVAATLAEMCRA